MSHSEPPTMSMSLVLLLLKLLANAERLTSSRKIRGLWPFKKTRLGREQTESAKNSLVRKDRPKGGMENFLAFAIISLPFPCFPPAAAAIVQ